MRLLRSLIVALGALVVLGTVSVQGQTPVFPASIEQFWALISAGGRSFLDAAFVQNGYINFGRPPAALGANGYGIRDNAGVLECKNSGGSWTPCLGGGGGAPIDATYVTRTANSTLTNEFSLGTLTTSLIINTVSAGAGTPTVYTGTSCAPSMFLNALDAVGAGTCGSPVTSVGLAAPNIFTVSGSPVTSTGTLTFSLTTQTANRVFAGPSSGPVAAPTFRALVKADLPALTTSANIQIGDGSGFFADFAGSTCGGGLFANAISAAGVLTCASASGGGTPSPPVNSIQFNNPLGSFDGDAEFTYLTTQHAVNLLGALAPSGVGGQLAVLYLDSTLTPSATTNIKTGIYNYITVPAGNAQTINNGFEAINTEADYQGSGTVQALMGMDLQVRHSGAGTITNQIIGISSDVLVSGTQTNHGIIGIRTTPSITNVTTTTPYVEGIDVTSSGNANTTDNWGLQVSAHGATRNLTGGLIGATLLGNITGIMRGAYGSADAAPPFSATGGIIGVDAFARTQSSSSIQTIGLNVIATDTGAASPTVYGAKINATGSGSLFGLYVDGDTTLQNYLFGASQTDGSLIIGTQTMAGWGDDLAGTVLAITGGLAPTAGHNLNFIDFEPGNDSARTIPIGKSAFGMYMQPAITTAASGTHPLIVSMYVDNPALTSGGAVVTEAASLYVNGAPTLGANNYALYVVGDTAVSRFNGQVQFANDGITTADVGLIWLSTGLLKVTNGSSGDGGLTTSTVQTVATVVASLPACAAGTKGTLAYVTDSTTVVWGATATGGAGNNVGVQCNGTNWTVFSK